MANKKNFRNDYGLVFINYTPTTEEKKVINESKHTYDDLFAWLDDMLENDYTVKFSVDRKNECLKLALGCSDEGSPNHGKMVFFRHANPVKLLVIAFHYDQIFYEGVWVTPPDTEVDW